MRVHGYFRNNGTYVQPHYRSAPDGNPDNDWSTRGNINPYTGKLGTRNPKPSPFGGNTIGEGFGQEYVQWESLWAGDEPISEAIRRSKT